MKLFGKKFDIRRPPPRGVSKPKSENNFFTRPAPKSPEYETQTEVVMYERKPVKTFSGPSSKEEARLLVSKLKAKNPGSRVTVKSKRVPKRRWF